MNVVVPMAGSDELFKRHGYSWTKALVEIDGRPLVEHAFECIQPLRADAYVFVVRKQDDLRFHLHHVLNLLDADAIVVRADGETAGAACTVLLAIEHIDNDDELIITNGDQVLAFDVMAAVESFREQNLDAATVVFDSVHPRWSFVRVDDDNLVIEAAEKRPLSRNATAGFYYFKRGRDFVACAFDMIRKGASTNGAYFVCPTFNEMILRQKRVGIHRIDREQYISLATPRAVEDYEQALLARKRGRG